MRQRTIRNAILTVLVCLFAMAGTTNAKTIYVDADAPGANDGSSWTDAYRYLRDALADADASGKPVEIRVAQGIYRPDEDMLHPDGTGDREATFRLINSVTLKGGYAGLGEPDPNARDIALYETILSGDLDGNDVNIDDPEGLANEPTRAENSYHVMIATDVDRTAVLSGVTITGGNANGSEGERNGMGGGMYSESSSPTFIDCTFRANSANWGGGCMYNEYGTSQFERCTFKGNFTPKGDGGGIFNWEASPTFISCTFLKNISNWGGGGMINVGGSLLLLDCLFIGNRADEYGGGGICNGGGDVVIIGCRFCDNSLGGVQVSAGSLRVEASTFSGNTWGGLLNDAGSPTVTNCIFSGNPDYGMLNSGSGPSVTNCIFTGNRLGGMANYAGSPIVFNCLFAGNGASEWGGRYDGGGMYNVGKSYGTCHPVVINSTFADNSGKNGKGNGLACDSWDQRYPSTVELRNCILWDGGEEVWNNDSSNITITYSNIEDAWPGEGNIDTDPCFAGPGYRDPNGTPENAHDDFWVDGDYHLKSQAGRWDASEGRWMTDDVTSPCIDAGDPMSPIGLEPFPNGGIVNMGAYGGTAEASKSYFGELPCETIVAGDVNGDCEVNFSDLYIMALHWCEDHNL